MLVEKDFVYNHNFELIDGGISEWSAPSNIALVKYWGKKDHQIPANPSISFTLKNCKTTTKIEFKKKGSNTNKEDFSFDFIFDGKTNDAFKPKIQKFLERINVYCPYLTNYHLMISSSNTFPHSSGIASSASGMAALAMNVMDFERLLNPEMSDDFFYKKASFLARLGSGSACRSVNGSIVAWGKQKDFTESNDWFGVEVKQIAPVFLTFQDTILLVDKGEKKVSSTVGHNLMINHPFSEQRFIQAHEMMSKLKSVLEQGLLEEFITIVEREALTLHAMMMTSLPYFVLMKPNTLHIINKIWEFRAKTNISVCFTLDAGANVHVLYPENVKETVLQFINSELVGYCQNDQYICDEIGHGAQKII
jgi:diphosphomevalonate decarboxylase